MKIGDTIYLDTNNPGLNSIVASPYTGNIPTGYKEITREQYASGLQQKLAEAQAFQQNYMSAADYMKANPGTRKRSGYWNSAGQQAMGQNYGPNELATLQKSLAELNAGSPSTTGQYATGPNGNIMPTATAANYISPEQGLKAAKGGSYLTPQQSAQSFQTNLQPAPTGTLLGATVAPQAPMQITLGNGQVVSVDKNGNFSDAQGNPITGTQVASAKAGTGAITSGSLSGATPITPVQPNTSGAQTASAAALAAATAAQTANDAKNAATATTLGKTEQGTSDLIKYIQDLNNETLGKDAYQTEQNKAFGVTTAQATKNSLEAKQRALLAKAAQIDLEVQQGQGVTTAIDSRQRTEAKRVIAVESLINTALIAAADGDLANAKLQADEAVALKYGSTEEKIKVSTANLNLIIKDPQATLEEKNRANAQLAINEQMKNAVDEAKQTSSDILKVAAEAAKNGADAVTLMNIQNAPDAFTALQAAGSFMAAEKALDTSTVEVGGRKLLIDNQTGQTIKDLGVATQSGGTGGNQQTDNERALMGQFLSSPIVKDYNMIISQKLTTDNIIANGIGGPADLALIFSFMKGLDPNSVVRESEYDTAAKSGNIFAGTFAKFNGYLKPTGGFLPENVKTQFQNLVNQKLKAQQVAYDNFANNFKDIARRQNLNPDNVVPNLGGALSGSNTGNNTGGETYTPGTTIHNNGILYLVGDDGETITPIANYAG